MTEFHKNKNFCFAPWVHMHVTPDGKIHPCCVADGEMDGDSSVFGKTNHEIMNITGLKNLRKDLIEDKQPEICKRCFEHEQQGRTHNSLRRFFMDNFNNEKSIESVRNTQLDGTIDDFTIQYLDIRFGNLCNFKCRMCGHALSSSWYDEHKQMEPNYNKPKFIHVDLYDQLEPYFESLTEIYFAGGEPLLYPEHYKILDKLLELGKTDVKLKYNSNLSNLNYKRTPVTEYWEKFDTVSIGASIDGMGSVVEYMRTNSNWEILKSNFKRVLSETTRTVIFASPTIGSLNVEMLPEFHRELYDQGMIGTSRSLGHVMMTNYVDYPRYQNIRYLPNDYKRHLTEKFNNHIEWLIKNHPETQACGTITRWHNIINYLNTPIDDIQKELTILRGQLDYWDSLNPDLNWRQQLPHLVKVFE